MFLEIIAALICLLFKEMKKCELKIDYHDYQGEEENEQGGQDQADVLK